MSSWTRILSTAELDARYSLTASIDPRFAAESRKFWETRTVNELSALKTGAWTANDSEQYQMARTYLSHRADKLAADLYTSKGGNTPGITEDHRFEMADEMYAIRKVLA